MAEKDPSTTPASSSGKDSKAASDDQTSGTAASTDASPAAQATTATPDPTQDAPSSERRGPSGKDKAPACPTCAGSLERYVGDNIHKLLTGFCSKCGVRHHLDVAP